jgi:hypothetical protein
VVVAVTPTIYFITFACRKEYEKMKLEKPIKYVRVNAYTWIGTQINVPDDQVRKKFYENLKLSPYYNPKKFFTIK